MNFHLCDIKINNKFNNLFEFPDGPLIPRALNYPNRNGIELTYLCIRMQTPMPITIPFSPLLFLVLLHAAPSAYIFIQEAVRQCTLK